MNVFRELVGRSSKPVKNEVEKGAIRKFADAIGDPNPLYRDEKYARQSKFGCIVAPPTFGRTFDYGVIEGLELPRAGLIHGEQAFEYFLPICAGDVLHCSSTLVQVFERQGRLGKMTFLVFERVARNDDDYVVVKESSTVIYRESGDNE